MRERILWLRNPFKHINTHGWGEATMMALVAGLDVHEEEGGVKQRTEEEPEGGGGSVGGVGVNASGSFCG